MFLALRKIINDTKEIISTPAVKLGSDLDAWNLKLIICRLRWRWLIHRAPFPSPLGTQLLTETKTSGKCWVRAFRMRSSITPVWSKRNVRPRTKELHFLENFGHLYSFAWSANNPLALLSAKHCVLFWSRSWGPCSQEVCNFSEKQWQQQHKNGTG